ncbi:MAG: VOC family protein [Chloroflexi bacterium]|nr:VOC family protein [Chloroflexota bacterium]
MLSRVDRVQLVVADRAAAVETWEALFGAVKVAEGGSRFLNAHRTTVQAGVSLFEFLEPAGPGPIWDFAERWRGGLYGVGFSTPDMLQAVRHLNSQGVPYTDEKGSLYLAPGATHGMPAVIVPEEAREPVGHISFLYEVTNPVADWQDTAALYTRIFDLDPTKFTPIASKLYGYEGTLTLFDPPARLDRIEITQTTGDGAMARFYQRRGPGLYMCYIETEDVAGLAARLRARNARFSDSEDRPPETGLFIHPTALHGMLMGVSRTDYAWVWSGRPELAGEGAAASYRAH